MKQLSIFCLAAGLLAVLSACDELPRDIQGPENGMYNFSFLLEDSLGNDMGREISLSEWAPKKKPIEEATSGVVDHSLYDFFLMVSPQLSTTTDQCTFNMLKPANGVWYMNTSFTIKGMKKDRQHSMRYMLRFPKLFGDENDHVLDAYWTIPEEIVMTTHYAVCDSLLVDGKLVEVSYTDHPNGNTGEKTNLIKMILP